MRISRLLDEEEPRERRRPSVGHGRHRARRRPSCARATASCSPPTRAPTATRSARCWACTTCSPARQGLGDVHGGEGVPAADRVPLPAAGGGLPRGAGRHGGGSRRSSTSRRRTWPTAPWSSSTAATSTACRSTSSARAATSGHQHRPPPRQHPLRRRQPRRHRRLLHRRDRLRAGDRCSACEITPEIASALYVGLVTDTGKFMYENTDARTHRIAAELIEAGVDVDDIYRRLYEHVPIEKLRLLSPRPRRHRAPLRRAARRHLHHRRRLRGDRGRRGDDRGDHRPPALGRREQGRGGGPRPGRPRARRPQGQPALQRRATSTSRRSPASTAAAATSAPPASPPISSSTSWSSSSAARSTPSSAPERWRERRRRRGAALRQAGRDNLARHGRARSGASAACKAGHAGTLDPFATGLLLVLLGRATRLQRFLAGLPKTYVATARLGWRSSTGDPDGELTETGRDPGVAGAADGRGRASGCR